jgi:hypothetical protein
MLVFLTHVLTHVSHQNLDARRRPERDPGEQKYAAILRKIQGNYFQSRTLANIGEQANGGEGGIRTPDTVTRMPHFECGAFNRSATSPNH